MTNDSRHKFSSIFELLAAAAEVNSQAKRKIERVTNNDIPGCEDPIRLDDHRKSDWEKLFKDEPKFIIFRCGDWSIQKCNSCGRHLALYQQNPVSGQQVVRCYAAINVSQAHTEDQLIIRMAGKYVFEAVPFTAMTLYGIQIGANDLLKYVGELFDDAMAGNLGIVAERIDGVMAIAEMATINLLELTQRNNALSYLLTAINEGRFDLEKMQGSSYNKPLPPYPFPPDFSFGKPNPYPFPPAPGEENQ